MLRNRALSPTMLFTIAALAGIVVLWLLTAPALTFGSGGLGAGDVAPQPPGDVVTGLNLVDVLLGLLVPAVGYVINHFGPQTSEQAKWLVQVVLAAGVGAIHQAIGDGNFGWNTQTLVAVLTVMATALVAHLGYKTGRINTLLGGGFNHNAGAPDTPSVVKAGLSS